VPGIETITLNQSAASTGTAFALAIQDTNVVNPVTIRLTGGVSTRELAFVSGGVQSNVSTIDASSFAGKLVMNTGSRVGGSAMTITGGSGDDAIIMKNTSDSLVGGSGNDTLKLSVIANDRFTFDLSLADQVVVWNGDSNSAVQSGFENLDAGGLVSSTLGIRVLGAASSGSSIVGTNNVDTINGGVGNDTIVAGGGFDFIDVSTGSSSSDRIDYTSAGQTYSTASLGSNGVTGVLGIDVITGMARGDSIKLYSTVFQGTGFNRGFETTGLVGSGSTGFDYAFQMARGTYDTTWTFSATGNDVLFQWDADGNLAGTAVESVVLVGSGAAFTGITANSAGVILFT